MQTSALETPRIRAHTSLQIKLVEVLAYFDIFNFPVTENEICNLLGLSSLEFLQEIIPLLNQKTCFCHQDYYSACMQVDELVTLRKQREVLAKDYFKQLKKYSRIISCFPFVRGVAVSGSLSKGVMQKDGDIDFFVVTAPGKLWLCRSLLILYKKIMLLNSHKYFCLNYFIDTNNLTIIDKNIFTATEIFYLLPVYSENNTMTDFFKSNGWALSYFEENTDRVSDYYVENNSRVKKILEKIFSNSIGSRLEKMLHRLTLRKWLQKFGHFDREKFELTMRSTDGVSKHHPRDFQSKVLKQHKEKVESILSR